MKSNFCWLSGYTLSSRPSNWWGPWLLEKAHIASGCGRARRVDDRRAIVLLCSLCHKLHVSDATKLPSMNINSTDYPTIDESHTLWLKQHFDPECYDEEFLSSIWIGKLPEPQRPPEYWVRQLYLRQGIIF